MSAPWMPVGTHLLGTFCNTPARIKVSFRTRTEDGGRADGAKTDIRES